MTVLMVALTVLGVVAVVTGWSAHRRRALVAWNRELEVAFGPSELRELPLHRGL